jgi:hypothetical protein
MGWKTVSGGIEFSPGETQFAMHFGNLVLVMGLYFCGGAGPILKGKMEFR